MSYLIPITVTTHSGYKADEYPKRFTWEDRDHEIIEILDRWYQGDVNPEFPAADYFKVGTAEGWHFILKHEIADDSWFLCK